MGISKNDLELLIALRQQGHIPLNPYVVELGAQQLSNSLLRADDLMRKAEAAFGAVRPYALPPPGPSTISAEHMELLDHSAPPAREFWTSLGFDYTAIDFDGSPGSVSLDLNYDPVPSALRGKYGLVTNLGTTEHICNQLNAFKVVHDLASPGAVMIHHLPAGGMLNHGLINYNPKFFWYLARSNDYKWLHMRFYYGNNTYPISQNILDFNRDYAPQANEALRQRDMSDYAILVALQKTLDIPFVAPIDVDTGAQSSNPALNRRYWTVLQPGILDAARRSDQPHQIGALLEPDYAAAPDDEVHKTTQRVVETLRSIPDRRYVAILVAISALSTAIIMAALLFAVQLLF